MRDRLHGIVPCIIRKLLHPSSSGLRIQMGRSVGNAKVVIKFLKKQIFFRFSIPRALINDKGSYFCKYLMEKVLKKYNVLTKLQSRTIRKSMAKSKYPTRSFNLYWKKLSIVHAKIGVYDWMMHYGPIVPHIKLQLAHRHIV